jgi:hypothetical protein
VRMRSAARKVAQVNRTIGYAPAHRNARDALNSETKGAFSGAFLSSGGRI